MAKHDFKNVGNTFASTWYMCDICGKLVSITQYILGAKDEECPGEPKEVVHGQAS